MESTRVTPETLRVQAAKVDEEADRYYNEYHNLLNDVEELTSTDWTGEDANEFREKVHNFEPDFNKMKELMNDYASYLRQAAHNYDGRVNDTITAIKGLR